MNKINQISKQELLFGDFSSEELTHFLNKSDQSIIELNTNKLKNSEKCRESQSQPKIVLERENNHHNTIINNNTNSLNGVQFSFDFELKHKNELTNNKYNNNNNEKQNNSPQHKTTNSNQTNRNSTQNSSNSFNRNFDIEFGLNLQQSHENNSTSSSSGKQTVTSKTTIKTNNSNNHPQQLNDNLNFFNNKKMSSTASEILNVSSNNSQNTTSNANQTPNEQQRRNKKRKPPNYYQSAEYANIIKHSQDLSNQAITSTSTSETSTTVQTKTNELFTESKQQQQQQQQQKPLPTNGLTQNEATVSIVEYENDKSHSQQENATNDLSESLKTINLNEQSNDQSKEQSQQQQQQQQTQESNQNESNKKWSSLFKASVASAAPVTSQVANAKQVNTSSASYKPSSNKSNQVQKSAVLNSNQQPVNGHSSSSSVSSLAEQSTSPITSTSSSDSLKTLGNFFKSCELKHSAPALQPRGIRNKQNWCYVNATLQALLACPPFYNLMRNVHQKIKTSNINVKEVPCLTAMSRFINEFKVMVRTQQNESTNKPSKDLVIGEPFEIEYFYNILSELKFELASGRQEDAQEFLTALLNKLHDEMIKCLESLSSTSSSTSTNSQYTETIVNHSKTNGNSTNELKPNENNLEEDDEWKEVGKKNRAFITRKIEFKQSPLSDIFCGQFRSALSQPGSRDKESVSLEPFFTIPLDIQADSIKTVQQALEHFVQKEEVFGFTNQDKQEIEAFKRISIEDLPPVLILYLKCFIYDKQGGIQKLLKRIEFQIDLEIIKELISPNQRSKLRDKKKAYKLFAVEYHHGDRATGGHYITDVYHPGIVGWVRYDDANVKVVNNAQVLKSDDKKFIPYLLYYRRADLI